MRSAGPSGFPSVSTLVASRRLIQVTAGRHQMAGPRLATIRHTHLMRINRTQMSKARTSKTHPIEIAAVPVATGTGIVGVTFCPGKKDPGAMTGAWDRDLETDLAAIKAWGASALVCLMEMHELKSLKVSGLSQAAEKAGLRWFHLPIRDVDVPSKEFEAAWPTASADLHAILGKGGRVVVHCKGGLGRSGTIAARLLVERGMAPNDAVIAVRQQRKGAIETAAQEAYVLLQRPLAQPAVPNAAQSASVEDRAVGCFLGLAIGDAVGTTLEFKARDTYEHITDMVGGGPFKLKPGQWTDDTSMALCLAESLLEKGELDPADLMDRFRRWRDEGHNSVTGKCFDIGITTTQAISRYVKNGNPLAGSTDANTAGNGSIMRLAPVPIFFRRDGQAAEEAAVTQSKTTHGALECLDSCRLMTRILVALLDGSPWSDAVTSDPKLKASKVAALAGGSWKGKSRKQIKSTGYVIDTLEAALWAVDSTNNFQDAILLAVNLGNDADTVGAVAGQFAGARYGQAGIPDRWLESLAWLPTLKKLGANLAAGV